MKAQHHFGHEERTKNAECGRRMRTKNALLRDFESEWPEQSKEIRWFYKIYDVVTVSTVDRSVIRDKLGPCSRMMRLILVHLWIRLTRGLFWQLLNYLWIDSSEGCVKVTWFNGVVCLWLIVAPSLSQSYYCLPEMMKGWYSEKTNKCDDILPLLHVFEFLVNHLLI